MATNRFVLGFTATREPLTDAQIRWIEKILTEYYRDGAQFHHGDCINGDEAGYYIAKRLGYVTVSHPPTNPRLRARTVNDVEMPPLPYLERNQQIVLACSVLVAVPFTAETPRSGTWATVRYARDVVKGRVIRNWWVETR